MHREAVILFAHGARDPAWADPLRRVAAAIRRKRPGLRVELAFLEFMTPALDALLDDLAAEGLTRITVVPAFMATGGHLRRDLPLLIEAARLRHPGLVLSVVGATGESEPVIEAIADYAAASTRREAGGAE